MCSRKHANPVSDLLAKIMPTWVSCKTWIWNLGILLYLLLYFNMQHIILHMLHKAPFTLRSIFGKGRIKLVPVPLFWFLDYLNR